MKRAAQFLRTLLRRDQIERELDEELRSYFETLIERHMARGLSREEATRKAHLEHEQSEQIKEKVRDGRATAFLETAARDIRYALRTLRKNPGFTAVAMLTLGLGIGANTAIFSLINAIMLRLLPVGHPEELVLLTDPSSVHEIATDTTEHGVREVLSYPEFLELRSHNSVFSGLLAAENDVNDLDVSPAGNSSYFKARSQLVSGNFFQLLGLDPIAGRFFTPEEDRAPGANPVAVISYGFWQSQFAGNRDIVGSSVRVGQGLFQIVGVAPPSFGGILVGAETDLWFPITMQQQVLPGRDYLRPRDTLWLQVMGRLAPGISRAKAEAGINMAFQQILRAWAPSLPTERDRRLLVEEKIELRPGARGASSLRRQFADALLLLMGMVGVVLLIACANVANLMLARASARQREIGVRLSLGAARGRLIRQLLTESLLVAIGGGILGIFLSFAGTRLLISLVSFGGGNLGLEVSPDNRVLLFTAAVSLLTGLLFGLAPAIRGTRLDIHRSLAANTRGSTMERGRGQTGRILSITQVALSMVLLMGAALFLRSLHNMLAQTLGLDRDHLLMITVDPSAAGYHGSGSIAMYERVRQKLATAPGIGSATVAGDPLFDGDSGDHLAIDGSPERDPEKLVSRWTEVGADYFSTLKIPLLRGRLIDASDAARGARVCVINQAFLRRFFPDLNALGRHITDLYPTTRETYEIIGVVADAKEHRPDENIEPRFYPNLGHPIGTPETVTFLLRTSAEPNAAALTIRKLLRQAEPTLPILNLRTAADQLDRQLITDRLLAELATFFGAIALLMAAVGLYGVMSYSLSRRISEIGIRMALGASARSVMNMVFRETLWMVAIGVAVGLPCGLLAARAISIRLYGIGVIDPASIATALLVILASAILAGFVPAHRASRVDPMHSLRQE